MAAHTNDPTAQANAASWPATSVKTCTIAGIIVNVFGLEEAPADCTEVACLWLLHPRLATQKRMRPIAAASIAAWNKKRGETKSPKGLIAVTFDQRNHGSREVDSMANQSWKEGNETHAQDMFSIYRGTALDTSLLLDHIASYAFPDRTVRIVQNIVLGISLGGHAAWHVLFHDPRFSSAVIVIGCPDYMSLMADRARLSKLTTYTSSNPPGSAFVGSKHFPPDLTATVRRYDPAGLSLQSATSHRATTLASNQDPQSKERVRRILAGKSILNMSGGADKLVPYRCGEGYLSWLKQVIDGPYEDRKSVITMQDKIFEGVGHEFTPDMLDEAVSFIIERVGAGCTDISSPGQSKM